MTRRAISYLRFSTRTQREGDSERRQVAALNAYVARHNLLLDTSHNFRDLGVSGFSGANRHSGALGVFLAAVRGGVYEPGSVLLIESIDRLSREKMADALGMITDIIRAGIEIVTLDDEIVYSRDTLNNEHGRIDELIGEIRRARRESERKSKLIRETNEERRKQGKRTRSCPGWLELKDGANRHTAIPEMADVVREIFNLADKGVGQFTIAKMLNRKNTPTLTKRASGWHKGPISALLQNPAVIGHFQHSIRDPKTGKPKPVDSAVIEDYYPAIIDPAQFKRVNDAMATRKGKGGRKGEMLNLLAGVLECAECRRGVSYYNTGNKGGRRWGYLRCDAAFRRIADKETGELICRNTNAIPHAPSQSAILDVLATFAQLPSALINQEANARVSELARRVTSLQTQFKSEQERLLALARSVDPSNAAMMSVVTHLADENHKRQSDIEAAEKELAEARQATTAEASIAAIKELRDVAENGTGEERTLARSKIAQALRDVIDFGVCYPDKAVIVSAGGGHLTFVVEAGAPNTVMLHRPDGKALMIMNGKAVPMDDIPEFTANVQRFADSRRWSEFLQRGEAASGPLPMWSVPTTNEA